MNLLSHNNQYLEANVSLCISIPINIESELKVGQKNILPQYTMFFFAIKPPYPLYFDLYATDTLINSFGFDEYTINLHFVKNVSVALNLLV